MKTTKRLFALALSLLMALLMAIPVFAADEAASADDIAALLTKVKLTGGVFDNRITAEPTDLKIDDKGRLVVTAGGTGGNLHLYADLGGMKDQLQDYTLEVKLAGITVSDGWHYGFGINNLKDGKMASYFTVRSGAYTDGKNYGTLMCYAGKAKSNTIKLGTPDSAFSAMSAALETENVISVTYKKETSTMVFKVNGVEVASLTDTETDLTLSDFCLVIPNRQTVAYSYMKVMDGEGNVVYNNDFTGNFDQGGAAAKHKVTVNYVYEDGTKAADSVTQEIAENAYYSIESTPIAGYKVENAMGKMGTEDVTVTITYKKIYKVTIHYVKADGTTVMEDYVIDDLVNGDTYSADSLPMANYTCDKEVVSGTINGADVEVTVTYAPAKLSLTIKYQYADGTSAAEDYTAEVEYGTGYSVTSPAIEGYTPDKAIVSADKISKKTEIVVTYTKDEVPTEAESETTTGGSTEKSGCSGVVGAVAVMPILLGAALLCFRKKED